MDAPKTLAEAIVYFSDPQRAFDYAVKFRWPDGKVFCPRCSGFKHSFIKTRRIWFCYDCKKQFTVKVKTVFEDSALPLGKWMTAVWMLVACKNGISSHELARSLGITQKSAWFMLQRIREALRESKFGRGKMGGGPGSELEADETYIGGLAKNMHMDKKGLAEKSGPMMNKTIVQGILDRNLRKVRAQVVPNIKRETLQSAILNNVKYGSTLYTDDAIAYNHGMQWRFIHDVINHSETYVRGNVHTNGIENFWSLLKRTLRGTYVAVEPFHLDRYLDEQMFRFNHRKHEDKTPMTDADRFALAMNQVGGKRLTYAELTGKDESPRHETTGPRTPKNNPF